MKKRYTKSLAMLCALATSVSAMAEIQPPQLQLETLTSGEKYVLFNKATPNGYMSRTSWDGALYNLSATESHYADYQVEAVKSADGSWMFKHDNIVPSAVDGSDSIASTVYLCVPSSTANINMKDYEALWTVEEGDYEGYYKLKAGAHNNTSAIGLHMHLNAGQQYWVVSYPGAGWYPDFDVLYDEDGLIVYDETETYIQMADSTSLNWAFVKADNVAAYAPLAAAYELINNYETGYLGTVDFEEGFQLTATELERIYAEGVLTDDVIAAIKNLIDAKVALYNELDAAIMIAQEGNDENLNAAITAAKSVFDTEIEAEALATAKLALIDAVAAHSQGLGDYTSLGTNMSFEDLSAQGGGETSSIAAPPAGWTLILGGDTVTTIDEIKNHGVTAWCGINSDCTGDAKDGNYGFGIWTSGMPTVELSQTIDGLENGTYIVSAALMVGANGNGSRRTTQRIFGNLNSTYFASEAEYDLSLLDNAEVYTFADLVEPNTDTELQAMEVRAYVYDGKLTFGMRTDGNVAAAMRSTSNSAGGDGWFKVDNFRIAKVGYETADALNVLAHYVTLVNTYAEDAIMATDVYEYAESMVDELNAIGATNTQAEINAAILTAKELMARMEVSVKRYLKLAEAIVKAEENYMIYLDLPGSGELADIISEITDAYDDCSYTDAEIPGVIAQLEEAVENCKKSEILVDKDITYIIKNPSFEDMSSQPGGDTSGVADAPAGWTLILDGDTCRTAADINSHGVNAWCGINSGDAISVTLDDGTLIERQPTDGEKLWGIWNEDIPEVELSQKLTGLPMGTYILTVDVMVQDNWAGNNITTQRIFGNNYVQMFADEITHEINLPADAKAAAQLDAENPDASVPFLTYAGYTCETGDRTTDLLHTMSVTFGVDESGVARIGFRTNNVNPNGIAKDAVSGDNDEFGENVRGQGWFKVDNFTLYYASEEVPTAIEITEAIAPAAVLSCAYYTAHGMRVNGLQRGVTIVKSMMSDGTVKVQKVMVK